MRKVIFLDDGGVINDNERRAEQWRLLVGAFLESKLGGDATAWGEANRIVFERQWQRYEEHAATLAADVIPDYIDFFDDELERWLIEMCEHVGIAGPAARGCVQNESLESGGTCGTVAGRVRPRCLRAGRGRTGAIGRLIGVGLGTGSRS